MMKCATLLASSFATAKLLDDLLPIAARANSGMLRTPSRPASWQRWLFSRIPILAKECIQASAPACTRLSTQYDALKAHTLGSRALVTYSGSRWVHRSLCIRKMSSRGPMGCGEEETTTPASSEGQVAMSNPRIMKAAGAMALTVTMSNYLVLFPYNDWMTMGTLTYPVAFLLTDLTNRRFGKAAAEKVVLAGRFHTQPIPCVHAHMHVRRRGRVRVSCSSCLYSPAHMPHAPFHQCLQH